jgi:hypothetical protein
MIATRRNSVFTFPDDLIRPITSERFATLQISTIGAPSALQQASNVL